MLLVLSKQEAHSVEGVAEEVSDNSELAWPSESRTAASAAEDPYGACEVEPANSLREDGRRLPKVKACCSAAIVRYLRQWCQLAVLDDGTYISTKLYLTALKKLLINGTWV